MSGREWQKVVQRVKATQLLQRMDDCNFFYNENRYTTSRDRWLIFEWLNRLPLTSSKKVAGLNKQLLSKIICLIKPLNKWMTATTPLSVLDIWIASSAPVKKMTL